ncbi:MAG TPA: dihydrofolate reductase [Bacteroidales bacterium]|nr:dihydrofolate reductase [Bacteroidales bacterium]HPS72758.1 dihydrofolate reductase [Bacteroidales bacterium]
MISIIVAIAKNNAIGKNNQLLWHIPDDLIRFKKITSGHPVIMGKKTWESLPKRPLPNRRNIVISDIPGDRIDGAEVAGSIPEAVALCNPDEETFVMGGASIYRQFLPVCDRLYLTVVHQEFQGDVFFPELNPLEWDLVSSTEGPPDPRVGFKYTYLVYDRVK